MIINRRVKLKNVTPKQAWDVYVNMEEQEFIANMRPTTDITEMCEIYSKDLPFAFEYEKVLFSTKQIKQITKLITEHLTSYVETKGGYDKLDLMTEEEIEEKFQADYQESLDYMAAYFNTTKEHIVDSIEGWDEMQERLKREGRNK